ncbi:MAG: hypothetical protein ACPG7F_19295, partial [Aggregatilineales bacterium]
MMKHDYSGILDFFRTGQLGDLRLGMTVDEANAYLGEPDEVKIYRHPQTSEIIELPGETHLRYGCVLLKYQQSCLKQIDILLYTYPEYDTVALSRLLLPAYLKNMSMNDFENFLIEHQVAPYRRNPAAFILHQNAHEFRIIFNFG